MPQEPYSLLKRTLVVVAGALGVLILLSASCSYIEPGHVGVKISRTGGGVSTIPLGAGYHFLFPLTTAIIEYPVHMQTVVYARTAHEGSTLNEEVNLNSTEGQPYSCDVSLSFELDPDKVPKLYERFRRPIDEVTHSFVRQTIREVLQELAGHIGIADLLGKEKASMAHEAGVRLQSRLAEYGFVVRQFTVNEVRPPSAIVNAIAEKNAMVQAALRAQNEKQKKEFEAQQTLITADADAKSILLKAEAQAKANELLTKSISPTLVNYIAIQKWNGQLPQVSGGALPFMNISGALGDHR
jgi:regulator of protease activity HflC (stomatin/prohibitin superfamily)